VTIDINEQYQDTEFWPHSTITFAVGFSSSLCQLVLLGILSVKGVQSYHLFPTEVNCYINICEAP
jgi:hypothetical protein